MLFNIIVVSQFLYPSSCEEVNGMVGEHDQHALSYIHVI